LQRYDPTITAGAVKVAAARTGLGFVLGPPVTILGVLLSEALFSHTGNSSLPDYLIYAFLLVARIFIWMLVLYFFTKKLPLPKSRLWLYSFFGAIVSSLLDWPGYALAIAAPGRVSFC
jgi:hypothetical protein